MKMRNVLFVGFFGVLACGLLTYVLVDSVVEPQVSREPASVPNNYESLRACEKQDILWEKVRATTHKELPEYRKFGFFQLLALSKQEISIKGKNYSDFAPAGWKKYLHGRGAIAKVKIVPHNSKYTGIFQGADCAFLRLSLTYKATGSMPVAPGLALKVLRDGIYSANVSALVSLDGQGKNFNFFSHPMSNIVPIGTSFGQKLVHRVFNKVTTYPEELLAKDMAGINAHGEKLQEVVAPRQIFFVPDPSLKFSSEEHEVRDDFMKIREGTTIYQIYIAPEKYAKFNYANYKPENVKGFLKESEHVADIVSTSEFIASEFGDDGIFFRHQLRP
ncbi:hypothetical protein [Bdellovibrio bacteriovorus]|uniref:hypothetical protein n=1 Tax=Bdellovibrio TaxID=958 RepID=UPI0035A8F0DC